MSINSRIGGINKMIIVKDTKKPLSNKVIKLLLELEKQEKILNEGLEI